MLDTSNPTTIVIFGASGDLTRRKLIPALFHLWRKRRLPPRCKLIGFADTEWDSTEFRRQMYAGLHEFVDEPFSSSAWDTFASGLHYVSGSFTNPADYARLQKTLAEIEGATANRLYYLATAPRFFAEIVAQLGQARMVQEVEEGDETAVYGDQDKTGATIKLK